MRKEIVFMFLFFLPSFSVSPAIKIQYGGNLKVAEELLKEIRSREIFVLQADAPVPVYPFPTRIEGSTVEVDLSTLNPDQIVEIEKAFESLKNPSHSCHWILDYPYFDHSHPTSISLEDSQIRVSTSEPDFLNVILTSPCFLPQEFDFIEPFRITQFGVEANVKCLAGRPFLDSITPVEVDPLNPFLSFKLNDVDVIAVPEDRYQQVSADPEISILSGPKFFVYLQCPDCTAEQSAVVQASINGSELARTVLNDHAEILLSTHDRSAIPASIPIQKILFQYPKENPYRIIAERIKIQLADAGFSFVSSGSQILTLEVKGLHEKDYDVFRYWMLRDDFALRNTEQRPWWELWEELESSGKLIPLLIHETRIAVRKNIKNLRVRSNGTLDFSNCWIIRSP